MKFMSAKLCAIDIIRRQCILPLFMEARHINYRHDATRHRRMLRIFCHNQYYTSSFCVLPNHIHILVARKGDVTLSALMNTVKGRFSKLMSPGRFWQPRFNFRIIDNDDRFIHTVEYIQYNYRKMELSDTFGNWPWVWIDWQDIQRMFK